MLTRRQEILRQRIMDDDQSDEYVCRSREEYADLFLDLQAGGMQVVCNENGKQVIGMVGPFGVIKIRPPSAPQSPR